MIMLWLVAGLKGAFLERRVEITWSGMDGYTNGALTVFLECCEEEGEITNRTCARVFVLERLLQK
jgi:hypothetical protein